MSNDPLPPIPTPMLQRWREFRIRVMPLIFFLALACASALLWKEVAVPPMLGVGFAETNIAAVASPLPGIVSQMTAKRFQQVKAGEPICQLVLQDPKVLAAELAVVEAEIQLIRIGMAPIVGAAQVDLNYYSLRLNLMKERTSQATDIVNLRQKEADFKRAQELYDEKPPVITPVQYELARTAVEMLRTTIQERSNLLERLELDLKNFVVPEQNRGSLNPITAAIAVQETKLREIEAAQSPRTLYAPIDGVVSFVHRRAGESVVAGESIITISSVQSEQIVAFVRQPLIYRPKTGMTVHVRVRTPHRETGDSTVIQVGAQMEPYSTAMLPIPATRPQEWGLPVALTMTAGLNQFHGELVDVIFDAKK